MTRFYVGLFISGNKTLEPWTRCIQQAEAWNDANSIYLTWFLVYTNNNNSGDIRILALALHVLPRSLGGILQTSSNFQDSIGSADIFSKEDKRLELW
jgi:hypothetical protein